MKLTTGLEAEIKKVMEDYWGSYFTGDLATWSHFLSDDYRNIGSTEEEVWNSKEEMLEYSKAVIPQMVGTVQIRNRQVQVIPLEPYFMVHEFVDMFINTEGEWVFYSKFRLSSLIKKTDEGWKVIHQHGSVPDSKAQEGESIGFQKISKENLELREAVKRRTVELEHKNRELEIETSLERVRAVAMSMTKPNDLLNIGEMLFRELKALGFSDLRNTLINTFVDEENYFNDYDYSELTGGSITRIPYSGHPVIENYIRNIRKDNDAFTEQIVRGKELEQWKEFRRSNGEADDPRLDNIPAVYYYIYSVGAGGIGISTLSSISGEKLEVLKRFSNVFDLAYKRYTDITKAEAQSREAQIELALERVRAKTMAMQKSDELPEAAHLLFQQMQALGMPAWSAGYCIWDEGKQGITLWMSSEGVMQPPFTAPLTEDPSFIHMREGYERGETFYVEEIGGEELVRHYQYMRTLPVVGEILDSIVNAGYPLPTFQIFHCAYFTHGLLLFITYESVTEAHDIFKRFAKVFDQTYTRFLDLQKAEEQAREAKIEIALERTRTQSMLMQHSKELDDTLRVFHEQVLLLGIHSAFSFLWLPDENNERHIFWAVWAENNSTDALGKNGSINFKSKAINYPLDRNEPATAQCLVDWKGGESVVFYHVPPDGVENYFAAWQELIAGVEQLKPEYFSNGLYYVEAFMKYGCFGVMVENQLPEEGKKILSRFAIEFERAYTRFLDLQKAEAQAREAQIEAGLERVRSRTMGMQKSEELGEVSHVINGQLQQLNFRNFMAGFFMDYRDSDDLNVCRSDPSGLFLEKTIVPYFDHPVFNSFTHAKKAGLDFYEVCLTFEEKNKWVDHALQYFQEAPQEVKEFLYGSTGYTISCALLKNVGLFIENFDGIPFSREENAILMRFGKVFEQTYTRFLDLQKAEAQAWEAQIEVSLERVRSKAMAMQKSEDLANAVAIVFEELDKLNLGMLRCGIGILNKEKRSAEVWTTTKSDNDTVVQVSGDESMDIHPLLQGAFEAWLNQVDHSYVLEGEDLNNYYKALTGVNFKLPDSQSLVTGAEGVRQYYYNAVFASGGLFAFRETEFPEEAKIILKRFADVFTLTYTRFNDLKQAEAQMREAKIEASLERVRSKAMAMHSSGDLTATIANFYHELELFSITPRRCGVGLLNKETRIAELSTLNTNEQGKSIELIGKIKMEGHPVLEAVYDNWLLNKEYHPVLRGNEIKEYYQLLRPQIALPDYPRDIVQYGYFFFFPEGGVYAWTDKEMGEDELKIYRRFTSVLSLTYKRYIDLQQAEELAQQAERDLINLKAEKKKTEDALAELKTTQFQLIQAEKMASLGELTAGIAHEIQNPLNFVNNFSEVNNELIDEMNAEIEKGAIEEARAIARDIRQNLEKINHHGKRADAIVKGMLQHSRNSTNATKEPTDINTLADEYVRLAYHGLRAKDNSFNATIQTDYDKTIGNINIIPQDIGRVILNLITNAFYTVGEKKKLNPDKYEPTVTVYTKKTGDKIEIKVADNGNGIPQKILGKIFQPFFTTKPTGQGTGLGLSLAYDIVKAHGGELKVLTTEGAGTTFIVQLPANHA